jgi:arylsulfatase A-like enzyme
VCDFAIAQAPVTKPSHRSLFHSLFPFRTTEGSPTLADVLRREGYQTRAFTGGGFLSAKLGIGRGFEHYDEVPAGFQKMLPDVESWLKEEARSPFFLFLHTYDIHAPYNPPPDFDTMFAPPDYNGPVTGPNTTILTRKIRRLFQFKDFKGNVELSTEDRAMFVGLYDGGIRYTDAYLGRLFLLMEELEILDRTLIFIFSDHGEEFWDHGSVSHGHTLYQELIRVPLLIRFPEGAHGGIRLEHPAMLVDVMPTVLEALGITALPQLDGTSLLPAIRGIETSGDRPLLSELNRRKALLRYPWKLIMNVKSGDKQLFNLRDDPTEDRSLAEERGDVALALQKELLDLLANAPEAKPEEKIEDEELLEQLRALGYIQ